MVTDRFMKGRIQGEGVNVKGLPVTGNVAICDNFIKAPPGSTRSTIRELVNRKEPGLRNFKRRFPRCLGKFSQKQNCHMIAGKLPVIQAETFQNGVFFCNDSGLFTNLAGRRVENGFSPFHPAARQEPARPIGMLD